MRANHHPKLSLFTATCIVMSNMVGTGVYTSLGFQVGPLPSGFVLLGLWLVGGVCALCGALCYGELGAALPRSGGEYNFLSRSIHPAVGFLAGFLAATVGFAAPIALAAMAFDKYAAAMGLTLPGHALALGVVTLVAGVHLLGVRRSGLFQNVVTAMQFLLVIVFIVAGFFAKGHSGVSFAPQADSLHLIKSAPFAVSLIYVLYAYTGWNASSYLAGEAENPARTIPLSALIGTLIVAGLYLALNATFLKVAPLSELAGQIDIGHIAAHHIFGELGGRIMSGLICVGLLSAISAMIWIGPRVAATMGEDSQILAPLAQRAANGVPVPALLMQYLIIVVLLLTAAFEQVLTYVQFSLTLSSFLTVAGVMILRWREPNLPRPYKTWGYPVTPIIFMAISVWVLIHVAQSNPKESLAGTATLLLGLVIYFASRNKPATQ